jgi:alpha-ribazole phosphatase
VQIYLIRHSPPKDIDGLCYGRLDVGIDEWKVLETAKLIAHQIPPAALSTAPVFSSPSTRCLALAQLLAAPQLPQPSEDLIEMDFGVWQGLRWDDIPRDQIDAWATQVWDYRPGGGESAQMVCKRWRRWLQAMRDSCHEEVIAVTHAGVIRVALADSGLELSIPAMESHIPFGSVHRLAIPYNPSCGRDTRERL